MLDNFVRFSKLDFLFKILIILLILIFNFFIKYGRIVGLILFECVFIVILVNGVNFIEVFMDLLLFIVVIDILFFKW